MAVNKPDYSFSNTTTTSFLFLIVNAMLLLCAMPLVYMNILQVFTLGPVREDPYGISVKRVRNVQMTCNDCMYVYDNKYIELPTHLIVPSEHNMYNSTANSLCRYTSNILAVESFYWREENTHKHNSMLVLYYDMYCTEMYDIYMLTNCDIFLQINTMLYGVTWRKSRGRPGTTTQDLGCHHGSAGCLYNNTREVYVWYDVSPGTWFLDSRRSEWTPRVHPCCYSHFVLNMTEYNMLMIHMTQEYYSLICQPLYSPYRGYEYGDDVRQKMMASSTISMYSRTHNLVYEHLCSFVTKTDKRNFWYNTCMTITYNVGNTNFCFYLLSDYVCYGTVWGDFSMMLMTTDQGTGRLRDVVALHSGTWDEWDVDDGPNESLALMPWRSDRNPETPPYHTIETVNYENVHDMYKICLCVTYGIVYLYLSPTFPQNESGDSSYLDLHPRWYNILYYVSIYPMTLYNDLNHLRIPHREMFLQSCSIVGIYVIILSILLQTCMWSKPPMSVWHEAVDHPHPSSPESSTYGTMLRWNPDNATIRPIGLLLDKSHMTAIKGEQCYYGATSYGNATSKIYGRPVCNIGLHTMSRHARISELHQCCYMRSCHDRVYHDAYPKQGIGRRVPPPWPGYDECNFSMYIDVSMYKLFCSNGRYLISPKWYPRMNMQVHYTKPDNREQRYISVLCKKGSMYRVYAPYEIPITSKCQRKIEI